MEYELKLADGQTAVWEGATPEDASHRYLDARRVRGDSPATVVAWRHYPRYGVFALTGRETIDG